MAEISLGRVTVLLVFARAAGYVLALGNSVILARTLGVERLGSYAYAMGIAALFGLLPNMGLSTVVTRTVAREGDAGAGTLRTAVRAQALLAVGVLVVIPGFAAILPGQPAPLGYVALAGAQLAVGTMSWPYLAVLAGRARYDRLAATELVGAAAGSALLATAAVLDGGVAAFLWAHLATAGIAVAAARWVAGPLLPAGDTPTVGLGALFRQATPFGATAAVQSLYTRFDVLLLGQMASTVALGLYNVAYKPTNLAVYFGGTVAGTLFPLMAQARAEIPPAFRRAVRGLAAAGPAMALAFSGLAGPLLQTLYGAEFAAAAPILVLLAWSAAANWLYAPLGVALQARGEERWWLACLAGGLVLNATGNLWAIPRWGAVGAAGTTLASEVVLLGLGAGLVRRKLLVSPPIRPIAVGVGAVAAGAVVLWLLAALGPLPATLAALVVYGGLLGLSRSVTAEDVASVVGWVRQGGRVAQGSEPGDGHHGHDRA